MDYNLLKNIYRKLGIHQILIKMYSQEKTDKNIMYHRRP